MARLIEEYRSRIRFWANDPETARLVEEAENLLCKDFGWSLIEIYTSDIMLMQLYELVCELARNRNMRLHLPSLFLVQQPVTILEEDE